MKVLLQVVGLVIAVLCIGFYVGGRNYLMTLNPITQIFAAFFAVCVVAVGVLLFVVVWQDGKKGQWAHAKAVREKYEKQWMLIQGVVGTSTQADEKGNPCFYIGLEKDSEDIKHQIGTEVEGIKIVFEAIGKIVLEQK